MLAETKNISTFALSKNKQKQVNYIKTDSTLKSGLNLN